MSNFKKKITDFHYGKFSFLLFFLFLIPSIFYFIAIVIKNFLYKIKIFKEKKVDAFVICVGNLTTGGVGKTPVVIEIANYFSNLGKKTCVISRGYGGRLDNSKVNVIKKDGEILIDDSYLSGDEVNLISKETKNICVITSKDRLMAANYAIENFKSEIIILDDGFSNRKMFKDLNLLLVDSKKLFGNGFCLPLGPLREPVFELKRADKLLIVKKSDEKNKNLDLFLDKIKIPYSFSLMQMGEIYNIKTKKPLIPSDNKNIAAFCAIGQPEQFYNLLETNFNLISNATFDDHFEYNQKIIDKIVSDFKNKGANSIITTEKDAVKILKYENIENIYTFKLTPKIDFEAIFSKTNN